MMRLSGITLLSGAITGLLAAASAGAQFDGRYPRVDDFGHQIYLEQHELPILAHGAREPAPAPDGQHLAFAARGWIWLLDMDTGVATQLTSSPDIDARPRWSPDGTRLAFVRDNGNDTMVVVRDMRSGRETVIDTSTMDLDPEFSGDGDYLFYTSGVGGSLGLWRYHLASGAETMLTDLPQVERNARRINTRDALLYLHGTGAYRSLRLRDFISGEDEAVVENTLTYHLTADVHPEHDVIVFASPTGNDYHLYTMDLSDPRVHSQITFGTGFAQNPAYSADGTMVYFDEPDADQQFHLYAVPAYGGAVQRVAITRWDPAAPQGQLVIETRDEAGEPVAARLSVESADGRSIPSPVGPTYYDSQTGRHYFYSQGRLQLDVPAGRYRVIAARGPMHMLARGEVRVQRGGSAELTLSPEEIWDAADAGYVSADYHIHLNGDGQHRASHADTMASILGEDLDHIAPMSWNRWERLIDREIVGMETAEDGHIVHQAQEVRSHFHGHIGLIGASEPFFPWFFGPANPALGDPDLTNGAVFEHADATGGFATYVHPIGDDDGPFAGDAPSGIPLEMVADSLLADRVGIEMVCAWTSPLGNAELWYRFLNVGRPVVAMSGTDTWTDFHRTPPPGTGRAYVRAIDRIDDFGAVLDAAIAGESFVTTGPALVFELGDGSRPGGVTSAGETSWQVQLASAVALDRVEIIVNGQVVQSLGGIEAGTSTVLSGNIVLPEAGWVAARAYTSERQADAWPTFHMRPFAHSSPIWIAEVGSTDPAAAAAAAADLMAALDVSEARALDAYGDVAITRLQARFEEARAYLRGFMTE
ncbi:CehA/McbA family metallohydrolase [Hyphobacterium sp. HN65]|uniref:CehA/McbA family metallohydrolase n=1 Tax=Hyphobacterium lacteum TaxID=3116575 RepID=A0ABU7LSE5_9PROT|nr:CehA/McbA family metallohydrolase [Hyphobacterium sp. HN65]MEE2526509.1 CehA/McbA family metallohydrolase [Hyphobacterium sp. HN65]